MTKVFWVKAHAEKDGKKIKALEGCSLDVAFKGKTIGREALFWEHEGNCAIRKGNWKLVRKGGKDWELYNIAKDRPEQHDLAAEKPALVKQLGAEFQAYADRANVSPVGTWRGGKKKKAAAPKSHPKKARSNPMTPISDDPSLPRVLLIGDSISIGYTLPVRELLKGKANVHRPPTNCASTRHGIKSLDAWLGDEKWDLIHFNWGLHDLKFVAPGTEKLADQNDPKNARQVSPEEYEKNLNELVVRVKKTGAKLIWRSTTPVPEGAKGRIPGDSAKYNAIAKKIMDANQIPIDDLYAFAKPRLGEIGRKADVHYTPAGSKQLAGDVAKAIGDALEK